MSRLLSSRGFSTLEVIVVVAVLALIVIALSPLFGSVYRAWQEGDRHAILYDRARVGMDRMIKALRQADSLTSITAAADADGRIDLLDVDGSTFRFRRRSSNDRLQYDPPDGSTSWGNFVDSVDSLYFTGYAADGVSTTTTAGDVRSVAISMTVSDEESLAGSVTLASRVALRGDVVTYDLVINEINYNPPGGGSGERQNEFVEIYNYGSTEIDVSGWTLSDGNATDSILDSAGTTIIPAGGYGIITASTTQVYTNYSVDAAAIQLEVDDTRIGNGLSNSGETITISDSGGATADASTYDDSWGGDGDGDTVERISATGGSSSSGNWEASSDTGSETPGGVNSTS